MYAPVLLNGFVWDDTALVARDPFLRSWRLLAEGFRHFLFTDATASDFYRPLQRVTYTWDYAWFGFHAWGWHLTNLLLHAVAAMLLFLFLERLLTRLAVARAETIAAGVALLWTIHPLHSSAVIYVSGRADLLAALFGFGGLYLALGRAKWVTFSAGVCFLAALLAKESGVTALLLAPVLALFLREKPWRWLAVVVLVTGIYGALRLTAEHETPPPPSQPISLAARPIVALRACAEYAGLLLAPVHLHMERDVLPFGRGDLDATVRQAEWRELQTLLGGLLLVAFGLWLRWARRREPAALIFLVAFVVACLPISNLLPLNASVAEHWMYFPSAFLFAAAALSLAHLRVSRGTGTVLLCTWAVLLAARTFTRNSDWRDERTFLETTIADGGDSARMLMNLGGLESAEGHQRIALGHFQNALRRAPDQPFALLGLGAVYLRQNDFAQARAQFERALHIPFVRAEALQNLAVLEYKESGTERTDLLREAARLAPKNWALQKRYLSHLDERGETKQAIVELKNLLQTQWWRGDSWHLLGNLWRRTGVRESAQHAYARAAALDVHDDEARRQLDAP